MPELPNEIPNRIDGREAGAGDGRTFEKLRPSDGRLLCRVARSGAAEVGAAVSAAERAQPAWGATPAVERGMLLHRLVSALEAERDRLADIVAQETGKSVKDAAGEVGGACALGRFYAGEGQRLYGRTTTSGVAGRQNLTLRQPIGVAGLIIAANTPIANVAWKVFPALICGNAAVLKSAEDTPATAWAFAEIAERAGLPKGVLNVVHGLGAEAGEPLVTDARVGVVSFTGSTAVGRRIAALAGERLARVSLELGGKNPFVVCDDADLQNACKWALLSAFSNAGQRCAAASRIIVMKRVYEPFRQMLLEATAALRVGPSDADDLGPVINARQLDRMLQAVQAACARGAEVLVGGKALTEGLHVGGFYVAPTLLENVAPDDELSCSELFGPIAALYRADDYPEALALANRSPYGLTACIHTRDLRRALDFCQRARAGVVNVNAATYGSEPHMPFGGVGDSGNGTREPGTEALDVYSQLKNVGFNLTGPVS